MLEDTFLKTLHEKWARCWPEGAPKEPAYTRGEKPLVEYLRYWADTVPSKPAIEFYGRTWTYAELDDLSDRFARVLRELSISPGDRVAVFMSNCPQFNIAYWGIMKAGAVHVPVSPLSMETELRHELGDAKPKAVICYDALLPLTMKVCGELGIDCLISTSYVDVRPEAGTMPLPEAFDVAKVPVTDGIIDFFSAIAKAESGPLGYTPNLDDVAALNYTGGTTGLPKGCVHTHRNILYTMASFCPIVFGSAEEPSDAVLLSFLPQFWIAGENAGVLMPVFMGSTLVLMARWDPLAFMTAVQRYKVNHCIMLVDNVDEVLSHPQLTSFDLTSLETTPCVSFVKKLNRDYRNQWSQVTGATMFETAYGMTETHTCDTFTRGFQDEDFDLSFDPSFVGIPVPGTDIKITDFETGELKSFGEEGEINVRSPSLLKGYWKKPELNAELFVDGWFKTGDLGMVTEDGFLRYLGRRKEMLKVNGMSVFPTEIETILGQNTDIAACGVIGREDSEKGQIPVAFIKLKSGSTQTESSLRAWCKETMSIYKVPEIHIVDELPMTATGKIIKSELEKAV